MAASTGRRLQPACAVAGAGAQDQAEICEAQAYDAHVGCLEVVLKDLLFMGGNHLKAYIWNALPLEATLPLLTHKVYTKVWHRRLGMPVPWDGPSDITCSRAV